MIDLTNPIFHDEAKAREHFEGLRWPDGPVCAHCGAVDGIAPVKGKKQSHRAGLYYCNQCDSTFTVTVGTVMERSKVPMHKWMLAFHLMSASKKGVSAHQLHRMLKVTYKTAWFMAHRIREAMADPKPARLGGKSKTIEADETYMGRRKRYRGRSTYVTGLGWVSPIPLDSQRKIMALVERGGRARTFHVDRVDGRTVKEVLWRNADHESRLMTDEATYYIRAGYRFSAHYSVNHSAKEYVSAA